MASPDEILLVLEEMAGAYPEKALTRETLELYLQSLGDIPGGVLHAAARQHIRNSAWFPKIAELRQIALRLAGVVRFEEMSEHALNQELRRLYALERDLMAAFAEGEDLDQAAWRKLIGDYETIGALECAERSMGRLEHYRGVVDQETGDEE